MARHMPAIRRYLLDFALLAALRASLLACLRSVGMLVERERAWLTVGMESAVIRANEHASWSCRHVETRGAFLTVPKRAVGCTDKERQSQGKCARATNGRGSSIVHQHALECS
jgi:hypothetical protein